jgi:hypothetical protein
MKTLAPKKRSSATQFRAALMRTWELNLRAIPTSVVWGISLVMIFQGSNLILRMIAAIVASTISLMNVAIINFSARRVKPIQFLRARKFRKFFLLNLLLGVLFVLALNNLANFDSSPQLVSVAFASIAISLFLVWMSLMVVAGPILLSQSPSNGIEEALELVAKYFKERKFEIAITAILLVALAPIIFFFLAIALTLTQAFTIETFGEYVSDISSEEDK